MAQKVQIGFKGGTWTSLQENIQGRIFFGYHIGGFVSRLGRIRHSPKYCFNQINGIPAAHSVPFTNSTNFDNVQLKYLSIPSRLITMPIN